MRRLLVLGLRTLVTFLVGALLLVAGGVLVLTALGFMPDLDMKWFGFELKLALLQLDYEHRMKWLAGGVVAFIIGMLSIVVSISRMAPAREKEFVLKSSIHQGSAKHARVTLSRRGVTALVAYLIESIAGVYDAKPVVKLSKKGWHVDSKIAVWGSSQLPEVIAQIEEKLHKELTHHTGITIHHLDLHAQYEALTHAERQERVR